MEHENAQILRAIADGEKVQYRHTASGEDWSLRGPWEDFDGKDVEACWSLLTVGKSFKWRIAPKTINIAGYEVPEPHREPLERNTNYWTFTPFYGVVSPVWMGDPRDSLALKNGFVHLTKEAALQHYEAIKSLLTK